MHTSALLILLAFLAIGGGTAYMVMQNQATQPTSTVTQPVASSVLRTNNEISQLSLKELPIEQMSAGCGTGKVAVDFLLDFSTSMSCKTSKNGCKIDSLKQAIANLMQRYPADSLIGAQTLERNLVSIDKFENVPDFAETITSHGLEGGTPTEKGMNLALSELSVAKPKFPDYTNWNLIVMTDGCPNSGEEPEIPAQRIRDELGVTIHTIGIELGDAGKCDKRGGLQGAEELMKNIAGAPERAYSTDASGLSAVADEILQNICK